MGQHHSHGHSHDHTHGLEGERNIAIAFFLNLSFTIFEIFGGFYVNSVAILSDALHDLGDSFSLGMAWYLEKRSKQAANEKFTFGYKRFSLLGALLNSIILIIASAFVAYHAAQRLATPEPTNAKGMLIFAVIGVLVNGLAALRLSKGKSMNEKVLSLHLLEDVLGWVAVLIVSIVILFRDLYILDPVLSLLITAYVLWNVIKRLKETLYMFLQGAPQEIDLQGLKEDISALPQVRSIHHTHLWSLDEHNQVFTIHIVLRKVAGIQDLIEVKRKVKDLLKGTAITHATIDLEFEDEQCYMEGKEH